MVETRLVIFDLDGTLVDSATDLAAAADAALCARSLPEAGVARVRGWIGDGARRMLERAGAWASGGDSIDFTALYADFRSYYEVHLVDHTRPYPGMVQVLDELARARLQLAVVTNKGEILARRMLGKLGLLPRFAAVMGGDSLARRKPSPEPLLEAAHRVGWDPTATVMIGDSALDVEAAASAGMRALAVNWGYGDPRMFSGQVDRVVSRPGEILTWLAGSVPRI